jgi:hypothetical protein
MRSTRVEWGRTDMQLKKSGIDVDVCKRKNFTDRYSKISLACRSRRACLRERRAELGRRLKVAKRARVDRVRLGDGRRGADGRR